MRSIRKKKKQSLFFANHFISLKAGKSDYLSPPLVKIQLFPPRFLEKRKKKEREKKKREGEKKRGWNIFTRYTTVSNRWIKGVTRNTFSLSRHGHEAQPLSSHVIFRFHLAGLQTGAYCVSWILFSDTREIAWPEMATG